MRVYTFTLPKFVSGIVRKCMVVFQKDEKPKQASNKKKRRKNDKMPG
ncbi:MULTISPECIES: stage V sporulation protein SpoVM [Sporosarcina]|nr:MULTISPECIES: stage V sporulation protein SpoVM [Sporosarcina]MDS9470540.1 stage V sporulation protein SpoVM [Sporosarcina pasteurii]QBQ05766.1 stage V sporulation protein SpoVM [Sporosarcina pasteurii]